jgi:hypothetical protein
MVTLNTHRQAGASFTLLCNSLSLRMSGEVLDVGSGLWDDLFADPDGCVLNNGLFNATSLACLLPDQRRLQLAAVIIGPILVFGLVSAAFCAQPGTGSGRIFQRTDRSWAVRFLLALVILAGGAAAVSLYFVQREIKSLPGQELSVHFCEVRFGGIFRSWKPLPAGVYLPEWGSMISAAFILYCGLHMLLFWIHDSALLKLVAAMFCVNGIASFFYHMTALPSWGAADGNSMLFIVWTCVAFMWDEFIETIVQQEACVCCKGGGWDERASEKLPAHYWRIIFRRAMSAVIWVLCFMIAMWLMTFGDDAIESATYMSAKTAHAVAFAAPIVLIILCAIILTGVRRCARLRRRREMEGDEALGRIDTERMERATSVDKLGQYVDDHVMLAAIVRLWVGVFTCIVSATCWIATEHLCDVVDFFKVFPGHLIWHVGMTWGLVNCLVFAALLRADNFRQRPQFVSAPGCLGRMYFSFLPGLVFLTESSDAYAGFKQVRQSADGLEAHMWLGDDPFPLFRCICCLCCYECGGSCCGTRGRSQSVLSKSLHGAAPELPHQTRSWGDSMRYILRHPRGAFVRQGSRQSPPPGYESTATASSNSTAPPGESYGGRTSDAPAPEPIFRRGTDAAPPPETLFRRGTDAAPPPETLFRRGTDAAPPPEPLFGRGANEGPGAPPPARPARAMSRAQAETMLRGDRGGGRGISMSGIGLGMSGMATVDGSHYLNSMDTRSSPFPLPRV